jgi:hypothetical protein
MTKQPQFLLFVFLSIIKLAIAQSIIIDHNCSKLEPIPEWAILQARDSLHIAYGHTSHGSQLTEGMSSLSVQDTNLIGYKGDIYCWQYYPLPGPNTCLDIHDRFRDGDLGHYGDTQWAAYTRDYLENDTNSSDINVIMWSWCGGCSDNTVQGIQTYLDTMNALEQDYPHIHFVYMTGHRDIWNDDTLKRNNQLIRDYCTANNKTLFDFADIESYNPDGDYFGYVHDNSDYYDENQNYLGNWAIEWQNTHIEGIDWFNCFAEHSQPLNGNLKAYAAWWLFCRLAGWDGTPPSQPDYSVNPQSVSFGQVYVDSTKTDTIVITNNISESIIIDSMVVTNSIFDFTVLGTIKEGGGTLQQGESQQIEIEFKPDSVICYNASLIIYSQQSGNSIVNLVGQGINQPGNGVHFSGEVEGVWNYPVIYIDGEITVNDGHSLQIIPPTGGTDVIFTGHYKFRVLGQLLAEGTVADSIHFYALNQSVGWHGLRFYGLSYNSMDSSKITYCHFNYGNATGGGWEESDGGGLFIYESDKLAVLNSTINNCSATFSGGAIHIRYCAPLLKGLSLHNNSADMGGGVYFRNASPPISECLFFCNSATDGGALYFEGSSSVFNHITITGNNVSGNGGALFLYDYSYPDFNNSIIWNNSPDEIYIAPYGGGTPTFNYCDINGGWTGTGNINTYPLFYDFPNGNLNLSWTDFPVGDSTKSPCIDSGDPAFPLDNDGTNTDMGALTFIPDKIVLDLKVFLEGPFDNSDMKTVLNVAGLLPLSQPYNIAPWNYLGDESVTTIPNSDIVDWILIELRDTAQSQFATNNTRLATKAVFLLKNGKIVDIDGLSNPIINATVNDSLFVIVHHRNHNDIMSANPLLTLNRIYGYDFTTSSDKAYGTNQTKGLGNAFGMFAGDANADGKIDQTDKANCWNTSTGKSAYNPSDFSFDGQIDNTDKNILWLENVGVQDQIPD